MENIETVKIFMQCNGFPLSYLCTYTKFFANLKGKTKRVILVVVR